MHPNPTTNPHEYMYVCVSQMVIYDGRTRRKYFSQFGYAYVASKKIMDILKL